MGKSVDKLVKQLTEQGILKPATPETPVVESGSKGLSAEDVQAKIDAALSAQREALEAAAATKVEEALSQVRTGRKSLFETGTVEDGKPSGSGAAPAQITKRPASSALWLAELGKKALGLSSMDNVEEIRYEMDRKALAEGTFAGVSATDAGGSYASAVSGGAAIVPVEFWRSIVDYLYPLVQMRKGGAQVIQMQAAELILPKLTGIPTPATWQEGAKIATSYPSFGQLKLVPKELGVVVAMSRQLVMDSDPAIEQLARDFIVRSMAVREDFQFLAGDGSTTSNHANLTGLFNTSGITTTAIATNGGPLTYNALVNLVASLQAANVPLNKGAWLMTPTAYGYLRKLADTQTRPLFTDFVVNTVTGSMDITANQLYGTKVPVLMGMPILISQQIPTVTQGATPNTQQIALVDMDYVTIGQRGMLEIEASTDAAYDDGGGLVSAFQQNQILYRAIERIDIVVTQAVAVSVLTGLTGPA